MNSEIRECPLIPMGAITGKPSKAFLTEILEKWFSVGVTQFMIYARSGCELEYMSGEWLDVCEWICLEAKRMGFTSIWIYDEYNWPSGTCKGAVLKKYPDYALNMLCVSGKDGEYEFSVRKSSLMSDLCNPDAVDCFIAETHEIYEKRLGHFFGSLIKGFFTDEPDIAFSSREYPNDILTQPYYNGLEEDYRKETGGELRSDILRGLATGTAFYEKICNRLISKKFGDHFAARLSAWCAKRGLLFTGHLMNEYSSKAALRCNGHPLEVLSRFSLPGMDEIFTRETVDTIEWLTLGTAMYAIEKQGNKGGVAELFALGPCDMSHEKMRRQIWLCAAFGISKYVLAVSQLTMKGNVEKPIYFNPFTPAQPWFPAFRELGEDAATAAGFASKTRICEIAVRYPYDPQPLSDLLKHLTNAQFSWKLILPDEKSDAEIILSLCGGEVLEERSGKSFFDFGCLESDLLKNLPRPVLVREKNGRIARDIFVRRYDDGSVLLINFSSESRELVLETPLRKVNFRIQANGLYLFEGENDFPAGECVETSLETEWNVSLDSPNTMRADFENNICEFTLSEDLTNLKFAIRNDGEKTELLLDGQDIVATESSSGLPQGFRELYLETPLFELKQGKHILSVKTPVKDYPYLPSVFLIGMFSATPDKILSPYRNDAAGLYGYAGQIIQHGCVKFPAGAHFIEAEEENLCCELFLDGKSFGRRLWPPFAWKIPEALQQKWVEVKLIRYTSCGPLFGKRVFNTSSVWLWQYRPDNERTVNSAIKMRFISPSV